jgi:uncharacterized protein YlxW (UPF0749 family)
MKLLSKIIDFVIVAMVFALIAALCFAKLEVRDAESVSQHLAQQVDSIQKDREKLAESLAQKEKELQTQAGLNDELRLEYEGTLKNLKT